MGFEFLESDEGIELVQSDHVYQLPFRLIGVRLWIIIRMGCIEGCLVDTVLLDNLHDTRNTRNSTWRILLAQRPRWVTKGTLTIAVVEESKISLEMY
jgi:hypothetical protein